MTPQSIELQVKTVFVDTLDLSSDQDLREVIYNNFKGWDSVAHMTLITALESKFDIMIDIDDILDMSTFEKAVSIVKKYKHDV